MGSHASCPPRCGSLIACPAGRRPLRRGSIEACIRFLNSGCPPQNPVVGQPPGATNDCGHRYRPAQGFPHRDRDRSRVRRATIRLRAARSTPEELLSWAAQWPERRWGVEGARGLGQLLAQQLVAAGEHVVDVPATLSARVRTLETGHGRKTDHIDARAVALVAAQRPDLPRVTADDHCRVLRLLADRRDELTSERRRTINRLHRHLRDLIPSSTPRKPPACSPRSVPATASSPSASRRRRAAPRAIAQNRRRCAAAVAASGAFATWRGRFQMMVRPRSSRRRVPIQRQPRHRQANAFATGVRTGHRGVKRHEDSQHEATTTRRGRL